MMSTPSASRRCTIRYCTNSESGAVDRCSCFAANSAISAGADRHAIPRNEPRASWVKLQSPTAPGVAQSIVAERALLVLAGAQRQRLVQRVAETGVDVPDAVGVVVGRKPGDGEHEVVRHRVLGRAVGPVHAADVTGHVVTEGAEQLAERAVDVEAVATPPLVRDAFGGCPRVDGPRLAEVQPHRLVGHPLDVGAVQPVQRLRPTAARPRAAALTSPSVAQAVWCRRHAR